MSNSGLLQERTAELAHWRSPGLTSYYACRVSVGDVRLINCRYHPAYDDEPSITEESLRPDEFLGGREQQQVVDRLGPVALAEIIAEVRARHPGIQPVFSWSIPTPVRAPAPALKSTPHTATFIASLVLLLLVGWLTGRSALRTSEWMRSRMAAPPISTAGVVRDTQVTRYQRQTRRGLLQGFQNWIVCSCAVGNTPLTKTNTILVATDLGGALESSRNRLAAQFPVGSTLLLWYLDADPGTLALNQEELRPSVAWLVVDVLLLGFGFVFAILLAAAAWVCCPFRGATKILGSPQTCS